MSIHNHDEQLFTIQEVAIYIGVNPQTVYRWIWSKKLPAQKVGRIVRVSLSDLMQTLDSNYGNSHIRTGEPIRSSQVSSRKRKPIWE